MADIARIGDLQHRVLRARQQIRRQGEHVLPRRGLAEGHGRRPFRRGQHGLRQDIIGGLGVVLHGAARAVRLDAHALRVLQHHAVGEDDPAVGQLRHAVGHGAADDQHADARVPLRHGEALAGHALGAGIFAGGRAVHRRALAEPEAAAHALRHEEHPRAARLRHRLSRGAQELHAVHVEPEGQDGVLPRRDAEAEGDLAPVGQQADGLAASVGQVEVILVIIHEQEAPPPVRAHGVAERLAVGGRQLRRACGQHRLQRAEPVAECAQEAVQAPQPPIGQPRLAEFAQRRLIVVGNLRHLALVEVLAAQRDGVAAAVIHVVAQHVAAGAQLDIRQRVHALAGEGRAVVVAAHHAAAHLAAGVGLVLRRIEGLEVVGADNAVAVIILVDVLLRGGMLAPLAVEQPRPEGVSAPQRQKRRRRGRAAPAGAGVEHGAEAAPIGDLPQRQQVRVAVPPGRKPLVGHAGGHLPGRGGVHVLVVQLHADDGPVVREIQPVRLRRDGPIEPLGGPEESRLQAAHLIGLAVEPVRQAAVAGLAVVEGADAQDHLQPVLPAQRHEPAQIAAAVEAERALRLLMVIPEHVRGHDGHAAQLHLDDLVLPPRCGQAGEVALAAHRQHRTAVHGQIVIVHRQRMAAAAHGGEALAQRVYALFGEGSQVKRVRHDSLRRCI